MALLTYIVELAVGTQPTVEKQVHYGAIKQVEDFKHITFGAIVVFRKKKKEGEDNTVHVAIYVGNGQYNTKNGKDSLKLNQTLQSMYETYGKDTFEIGYIKGSEEKKK